jgi:hypothetical protein
MLEIFKRLLEVQDLELPQIVFVTGPDALKHGYGNALGWKTDVGDGDIFGEGTHRCRLELGSRTATKRINSEEYVINLDHEEIVQWNSTLNVTRRQKNEWLHGVQHWTNRNTTTRTKKVEGSCMDHLYSLDTGLV